MPSLNTCAEKRMRIEAQPVKAPLRALSTLGVHAINSRGAFVLSNQ